MSYFKYTDKSLQELKEIDKILCNIIEKIGEIGEIEREVIDDPFEALILNIIGQQISMKAADTVIKRFKNLVIDVTDENINNVTVEDIQMCGMSTRKAVFIKGIAKNSLDGEINFKELLIKNDDEIIEALSKLKGVGVWTAEMILIFSLNRMDVLSFNDLVLRNCIMKLYNLETLSKKDFNYYKEKFSPNGSLASLYLWKYYSDL